MTRCLEQLSVSPQIFLIPQDLVTVVTQWFPQLPCSAVESVSPISPSGLDVTRCLKQLPFFTESSLLSLRT